MKLIILAMAMATSAFTSCDSSNSSKKDNTVNKDTTKTEPKDLIVQKDSASLQNVLTAYLTLKNALIADKSKEAAEASKLLKDALDHVGGDLMTVSEQKSFVDLADDSKEHAEHIASAGDDIKHQREHFQMLSKDIYDLVKAFGTTQTLYKDYCPMVKAIWLSETRPIKNPYYGKNMLTCGEVRETIQK
ncbi:MAG TPA: DUF3347 domain-containing protein [Chitinophagaceae bacterium]|nr:DUF3347 domain-containing protein [Chitinophagaceae bacterium]